MNLISRSTSFSGEIGPAPRTLEHESCVCVTVKDFADNTMAGVGDGFSIRAQKCDRRGGLLSLGLPFSLKQNICFDADSLLGEGKGEQKK